MQDLTDLKAVANLDPKQTLESTELLAKQCTASWKEAAGLNINLDISRINNIIFCGMGASIYGALVVKALYGATLRFPTETTTDYHLPGYSNHSSLVILTSYSGNTEEVLSCAEEAKQKGTQILVLTGGGKLAEFAKSENIPAYVFDGSLNPSKVPRLGCGYTIIGLMGLLHKSGIINVDTEKLSQALVNLEIQKDKIKQDAMRDSQIFEHKIPIIFAAEHLSGNAQILRNQFNETSKAFSAYYLVPDLNHHLMEGLQFPKNSHLQFLIINSPALSGKNKKRMRLTTQVVTDNHQQLFTYSLPGTSLYTDVLQTMVYGSFLTLYLALRYDQNPAVNPWVDWFKQQLSQK